MDRLEPKSPREILIASPSYAPAWALGGPVRGLEGLAKTLVARGARVRVVTTDWSGRGRLDVPRGWCHRDGVEVLYLPHWVRPDITPSFLTAVRAAAGGAQVVHVTGVFSVPTMLALAALSSLPAAVVLSPRGAVDPASLIGSSPRTKKLWMALGTPLFRRVDLFHATSPAEADAIREAFGPQARVETVPNGVEIDRLPLIRSIPTPPFRVGFLGRIHPIKGIDLLVEAVARLGRNGLPLCLAIAGPAEDEAYERSVRSRCRELGIDADFRGEVTGIVRDEFLDWCDVLVLPSHRESFGNVVIEALARRVPVVASRGTPWRELETSGAGAWVEGTVEGISEGLEKILRIPEEGMRAGLRGHALVLERYAWKAVAASMMEAYRRAIDLHNGLGTTGRPAATGPAAVMVAGTPKGDRA